MERTLRLYLRPLLGSETQLPTPLEIMQTLRPLVDVKNETAPGLIRMLTNTAIRRRLGACLLGSVPRPSRRNAYPKSETGLPCHYHGRGCPRSDATDPQLSQLRHREDRFASLCLHRVPSQEIYRASWEEIDLENAVWTIPAERMKGRRVHRIPLCSKAVAALKGLIFYLGVDGKGGWAFRLSEATAVRSRRTR